MTGVSKTPGSNFPAVVGENIKLIYLRKDLVVDLAKAPETFESKVIGSFVMIEGNPMRRSSLKLQQVTGVKMTTDVHLQVSSVATDVPLCMLSNGNIIERDIEDLRRRFNAGLLTRPTTVELEMKAKMLHEDITKHELRLELEWLEGAIGHYNIRGLHNEKMKLIDRREQIEQPSELKRRLSITPKVIAEESEPKPASIDELEKETGTSTPPESNRGATSSINHPDVTCQNPRKTILMKELYEKLNGPSPHPPYYSPAKLSHAASSSKGKRKR